MNRLAKHQDEAVAKMKDGCILWGGVGTGKSRTAIAYYMMAHHKQDLIVITTAKKRDSLDWEGEAAGWSIGKTEDSTVAGVLVVDSWNNIGKYEARKDAFFIFDEQRLVGSGSWTKSFLRIAKQNSWILLSGTPGDTWLDYIPVFIANGFYKNRTEFKLEHVVYSSFTKFPKVERYLGVGKLIRLRNEITVAMPFKRHTTRKVNIVGVNYDKELYDQVSRKRWNPYTDKPVKSLAELAYVLRRVVNSHPDRLEGVRKALSESRKVIVFYNFDYELECLRELYNEVPGAEWNGHKHQDLPTGEDWVYLVQYTSGCEGWNCITTDRTLFYSLTYSYKQFEQAQGRTDRMNTPYSELYLDVLLSQAEIDGLVWTALRHKKNFQVKGSALDL